MKINVDVLSLSATPIPRTLQMAIMGVKNMSLLETAPENRYPIQTYVLERNETVIKDAIERELARNGQIFYIYNRIDDIELMAAKIQKMVPEARIRTAHGQMNKIELEEVVQDFIDQKIDVLISTTIIETGIDIPNANTLIIHEADRLGLAQLYQIRGRVGRSNRIAYAYLMYTKNKILTETPKNV
jgi:transcription-repair coupling factor (superfamily II helicase)